MGEILRFSNTPDNPEPEIKGVSLLEVHDHIRGYVAGRPSVPISEIVEEVYRFMCERMSND